MAIKISIPSVLQKITGDQAEVTVQGKTIHEALDNLESQYPEIKERLRDENGALRRSVNIYVNQEDIRFLDMEKTTIGENDEISIVPAVAGG